MTTKPATDSPTFRACREIAASMSRCRVRVRPKRWWSLRGYLAARRMAKMLNTMSPPADAILAEFRRLVGVSDGPGLRVEQGGPRVEAETAGLVRTGSGGGSEMTTDTQRAFHHAVDAMRGYLRQHPDARVNWVWRFGHDVGQDGSGSRTDTMNGTATFTLKVNGGAVDNGYTEEERALLDAMETDPAGFAGEEDKGAHRQ